MQLAFSSRCSAMLVEYMLRSSDRNIQFSAVARSMHVDFVASAVSMRGEMDKMVSRIRAERCDDAESADMAASFALNPQDCDVSDRGLKGGRQRGEEVGRKGGERDMEGGREREREIEIQNTNKEPQTGHSIARNTMPDH